MSSTTSSTIWGFSCARRARAERLLHGVGCVIRAAHQRSRFDMRESHLVPRAPEFVELGGRNVPHNRQVLGRGPQILAQRQYVDVVGAEVAHHFEHFVRALAESE